MNKHKPTSNQETFTEGEVARHWDDNADVWTEHVRKGWDSYREHLNNPAFLKLIGNIKGKTVLDAGCGEGSAAPAPIWCASCPSQRDDIT